MTLLNKLMLFARSPQGRRMTERAVRYARSPEGRRRITEASRRVGNRRRPPLR